MAATPAIAPIWRGRTRRDVADDYEPYLRAEGIPPLQEVALGVQHFREDRDEETWRRVAVQIAATQANGALRPVDQRFVHKARAKAAAEAPRKASR